MKLFVVRAGENGECIQFNLDNKIASVKYGLKVNLKHVHDLDTIISALDEYWRTLEAEDQPIIPGFKTEAGRRTRAIELLTFAHDINRGDLIFTPDPNPKFRDILVGKVIEPYLYWPSKHTTDLLLELPEIAPIPIRHILEKVEWHEKTLPRDEMPETICSPGHSKKGVDQRRTVYEIKNQESRHDLQEEMMKRQIHFGEGYYAV